LTGNRVATGIKKLNSRTFQDCFSSGLARVNCAQGQEIFLHPPSIKAIEFEMKNECESCGRSKSITFTVAIF